MAEQGGILDDPFFKALGEALAEAGVFDRMAEYDSDALPGDWRWTCTACPVQAEGHLDDGRMGYFRARHGEWRFDVSPGPTNDVQDAVFAITLAEGDDPHDGFAPMSWSLPIVLRCIEQANGGHCAT